MELLSGLAGGKHGLVVISRLAGGKQSALERRQRAAAA